LPEQLNSNLRILDSLNERLTHVLDEIRAAKFRLDSFLQKQSHSSGQIAGGGAEPGVDEIELDRLREELGRRLKRYTKYHPDVLQLQGTIEKLEQNLSQAPPPSNAPIKRVVDNTFERQRRDIQAEIVLNEKDRDKLQKQIVVYKKRVEDTPKREQELLSLQRDYDNIRSAYHSLLGRQLEAQIAVNMEKKQKGEQFRIIDPARVPQKPVQPNIKKMVVFVLGAGLAVGCGIVALLEFMMQTFRGTKAVESYTSIPVIASIPTIQSKGGIKTIFLSKIVPVIGGAVAISLLGCFLGLAYIKG